MSSSAANVTTFPTASFNEKYPPEPLGHEGTNHARVWNVYKDHVWNRDAKKLDSWNRTLDILLIFAGLFSAVLTAFLVESYQKLSEDPSDYMADLLFRVVSNNGSFVFAGPQSGADPIRAPGERFEPPSSALWVNGLWFTSVSLTLSVALLCILAKQWLSEYEDIISADATSAHYWTRRHVNHWKGLEKWALPVVVSSVLPSLLHLALFLFLLGLYLFLLPLQGTVATVIAAIGSITLTLYTLPFIIPLWDESCAFRSPLAQIFRRWLRLGTHEEHKIAVQSAQLDAEALGWLVYSPDRNIASVATQAIGSTRPLSATAEHLRALGVHRAIGDHMTARAVELSDTRIISDESALLEHVHSVRAMLCTSGGLSIAGATPLTEIIPTLQQIDAQLLNHLVHILQYGGATAGIMSAEMDSDSMLLRALERINSERREVSDAWAQTQSTCHPSTFFMLFDILQIRLFRLHGIDTILEEELEVIGIATPDRRRKSRAVAIHCATIVHLVHAFSPSNLDDNGALSVSLHLARCSDALSRTTRVLMFPGITLFPPRHFETKSRFIIFTTWICLAAQSKDLLFSPDTELVLARDIAAMALTFAPVFNDQDHLAPITAQPYWTYVSDVAALNLPWAPSDLDSLITLYRHRRSYLDIEEPRTRRSLALLINHVSSFEPDALRGSGPFVAFFCCDGTPAFSQRDFNNTTDGISHFLISHNDRPSAWETLHNVICANRTANTYVVQLAISLASAIRTRLISRPTAGIRDDIIRFFGTRILGDCVNRLCADYLELANTHASESQLEGRLQIAANFLADCACICPQRTAEQIWSLIGASVSSQIGTDGTATSTMVVSYLGWVKEYDPRQAQVTTMHMFCNSPDLNGVTRISQLTAPLCGSTTAEIPRAVLEASVQWDFWSACDLVQHQDILATSRLLAHRILASQSGATVSVPTPLLSVVAELVGQGVNLTSDREHDDNRDLCSQLQAAIVEYVSGLGAYQRFRFEEVHGPANACVSAALLNLQSLAAMYDM